MMFRPCLIGVHFTSWGDRRWMEPGNMTLQRSRIFRMVLFKMRITDQGVGPAWQRQSWARAGRDSHSCSDSLSRTRIWYPVPAKYFKTRPGISLCSRSRLSLFSYRYRTKTPIPGLSIPGSCMEGPGSPFYLKKKYLEKEGGLFECLQLIASGGQGGLLERIQKPKKILGNTWISPIQENETKIFCYIICFIQGQTVFDTTVMVFFSLG